MSRVGNSNSLPGSGVRIIESTGNAVTVESHLETIQAANNRLRMLKKYNPQNDYWIAPAPTPPAPKVTVAPIPKFTVERIV